MTPPVDTASAASPSRWRGAALVVFALFVVYNANLREVGGLDAFASMVLPISILEEGNFDLNEFDGWIRDDLPIAYSRGLFGFGSIQRRDGDLLSSYPPGTPLLAVPLYAIPHALGWLDGWHSIRVMAKLSASLMVALSAGVLFLLLRERLEAGPALLLAGAYGLGTAAWPIASQGLWQHGPGLLCLSVALLCLARLERGAGAGVAALAGTALGLAIAVRLANVLPAAALGLLVLFRHRRLLLPFALPALLLCIGLAAYNMSTYGTLTGGYAAVLNSPAHAHREQQLGTVFSNPLGFGLLSILFSPSKGLFIYSPYLVFGLPAAYLALRHREANPWAPYLVLWVVLGLLLNAKNRIWWGGGAFGPRYLLEATLPLTMLIAAAWPAIAARVAWLRIFAATAVLSIAIQGLGAFFAPCGWDTEPVWVERNPQRFWDWRDPEIARCFLRGLEEGPMLPDLLRPETSRRLNPDGSFRRGL